MATWQRVLVPWLDNLWIWRVKKILNTKTPYSLPYPERNQFAAIKTKQKR
jgi:hypothetical protein